MSDLTRGEKAFGGAILIVLIITGVFVPFLALFIIVVLLALIALGAIVGPRDKRTGTKKKSARGIRKDDNAFIMILLEGREILHWVVMAAITVFVVFTVLAMLRNIPILWEWPGWIGPVGMASLLMLSSGDYSVCDIDPIKHAEELIGQVVDAFVQGLIAVFNAIIDAIILVLKTIGDTLALFVQMILLPPAGFIAVAFNSAADSLAALGISAPLAMIIVVVSVGLIIALVGLFVYRQLTFWED
ncbi:MAG: hypothetical protein KAU99_03270 [Thermoplasmata archaeon]|nr:hypothetical protein [Thermoplasmata archaeon]